MQVIFYMSVVYTYFQQDFKRTIPIVMSPDDNYVRPTIVAMTSIFENAHANTFYDVNILVPGNFKVENKAKIGVLKENFENFSLKIFDMGNKFDCFITQRWPATAFYRLHSASLFTQIRKCIYLDGDVLVRHDLLEMYDTNVDEVFVAGVCMTHLRKGFIDKYIKVLRIPDMNNYISSGVMLMNLHKIREGRLEEKFSNFLEKNSKTIGWADQDVLNVVCYGKILCLPWKYGFHPNLIDMNLPYEKCNCIPPYLTAIEWESKDFTIIHFGKKDEKPWNCPQKTQFHQEWWEYALRTNAYNEEDQRIKVVKKGIKKKKTNFSEAVNKEIKQKKVLEMKRD